MALLLVVMAFVGFWAFNRDNRRLSEIERVRGKIVLYVETSSSPRSESIQSLLLAGALDDRDLATIRRYQLNYHPLLSSASPPATIIFDAPSRGGREYFRKDGIVRTSE